MKNIKVYILLEHNQLDCSNCRSYSQVNTYFTCLTESEFVQFCDNNNFKVIRTNRLIDYAGFERYTIVTDELLIEE